MKLCADFPSIKHSRGCVFAVSALLLLSSCENGTQEADENGAAPSGDAGSSIGGGGGQTPSTGGTSNSDSHDGGTSGTLGSGDIFAHVRAVSVSGEDGNYTFNVTVESSDLGCEQFCNWWEILDEEGKLLYRRILNHSHTDDNGTTDADAPGNSFTRSGGPVAVNLDGLVYFRAHMNTGGYDGDIFVGSVTSGFTLADDVLEDFSASIEFEEPQSDRCDF